jgi:RNA polymerase sigma factor (sigma-70 family)
VQFYLLWNARLCAVAEKVLRDQDAAEDAASEAVIRIQRLACRGSIPTAQSEAAKWIYKQIRGCALRQLGRRTELLTDWIEQFPARDSDPESEPSPNTERREITLALALKRLPKDTRAAVLMRYLEGLPYREIARKQGGTVAGARSRVARGIQAMIILTHARKPSKLPSREERVQIKNIVATARGRNPTIGMRSLAAEVCRQTGIYIRPHSKAADLLGNPTQRRK